MPSGEDSLVLGNHLLAALPRADLERLVPLLELVSLDLLQNVHEAGQPVAHVYFPTTSILSMTLGAEGGIVEVAMVGNEGMAGLSVFFGAERCPCMAICQLQGQALRMKAESFQQAVRQNEALHELLHRYAAYLLVQSFQSTVCNRLHTAEERMCRWLLMTHDRAEADRFSMTHDFLARMLGVRRPTASLIAGTLQKAGLIKYSRGKLTVLDWTGLESASCECYSAVRKEQKRLLG